ncbi:MAG: type II secretion system protein N [Steroidobacteraceae bacterium]
MRSRTLLIGLAVISFVLVLIARLPLSWVTGLMAPQARCESPSGSIWQGRCGALTLRIGGPDLPVGAVSWRLDRVALLRAHVAGEANAEGPMLLGHARFDASAGGDIDVRDLDLVAPLDRRLLGMVPPNWTGRVKATVPRVTLRDGKLVTLAGTLEAHDVVAQGPAPDQFGSYALEFPATADGAQAFPGKLRDLDGPVEVSGTFEVRPNQEWELNALVRARPNATPQLAKLLEYLGPPDAQGRRTFSAAGDF